MIVLTALILGALFGAWRARARKGNRLDILQYAAIHGLIFAMLGVFVTIFLSRML